MAMTVTLYYEGELIKQTHRECKGGLEAGMVIINEWKKLYGKRWYHPTVKIVIEHHGGTEIIEPLKQKQNEFNNITQQHQDIEEKKKVQE